MFINFCDGEKCSRKCFHSGFIAVVLVGVVGGVVAGLGGLGCSCGLFGDGGGGGLGWFGGLLGGGGGGVVPAGGAIIMQLIRLNFEC